jgi:hypothetical protein
MLMKRSRNSIPAYLSLCEEDQRKTEAIRTGDYAVVDSLGDEVPSRRELLTPAQ